MGKEDKIIEMPTNTNSLSIMSTYKKLTEVLGSEDILYIAELTADDIRNIENVYGAAAILSGLGMRSGIQYATARARIESLIGTYDYPIEVYRTFAKSYSDLLKYRSLYLVNEEEQELAHKLA